MSKNELKPKLMSIDEYKQEMIGKTYGWLTVLDVYKDSNGNRKCKCICRCGSECIKDLPKVLSGHTKSCECYKNSIEHSEKQKQWQEITQKKFYSEVKNI